MNLKTKSAIILLIFTLVRVSIFAEEIRPYILGSISKGTVAEHVEIVNKSLLENDFEVVGEYQVNDMAVVIIYTNEEMKSIAAKSEFGGYGAVQRISITNTNNEIQIAYTNPNYITNVYRLENNLESIAKKLKSAIGFHKDFGSKKGFTAEKLRKYHYKAMMPYFDDQTLLGEYATHSEAIQAVENGFMKNTNLVEKLYSVVIPGKDEVVFGVAIKDGSGADERILATCDKKELKHTCYLPYEILVSGNKIYAMEGKFRIAISFPDLSMGTFMKISTAPGAITKALKKVAKNE